MKNLQIYLDYRITLVSAVTFHGNNLEYWDRQAWGNSADFIEPAHEIMALFVLHKLILQMCMRGQPVGLDV